MTSGSPASPLTRLLTALRLGFARITDDSAARAPLAWYLPLLLLLPPAWMAWAHSCWVPRADHWHMIGTPWLKHLAGDSLWHYFHAPGNDSHHDAPKVLHWLVIRFMGWDMRIESLMIVAIAGVCLWLLLRLCWLLPLRKSIAWGLAWLACLLLLSPQQWMNWTWGVQICYVLVVCGAVGAIMAFASAMSLPLRALVAAFSATVAVLSFVNGWLAWLLGSVALAGLSWQSWRGQRREVLLAWLVWIIGFVVAVAVFLYEWPEGKVETEQGMVQRLLEAPLERVRFLLALLGAPFADTWPSWDKATRLMLLSTVGPWLGGLTLGLLLTTLLKLWRARAEVAWSKLWPWALLGLWGLGNAAAVAIARTGHPFSSPFESRYPAYTLWLHVVLLVFMAVALQASRQPGGVYRWLCRGWLVIVLWGWGVGALQGWRESIRVRDGNHLIEAAATLRHVAPEPVHLDFIEPGSGERVLHTLDTLQAQGLLRVATLASDLVSAATQGKAEVWDGQLKDCKLDAAGGLHLEGWAMNKATRLAAPAVLISYEVKGEPERWLGLATRRTAENKLAARKKAKAQEARIGWEYEPLSGDETAFMGSRKLSLSRKPIPTAEAILRAYVLEPRTGTVTALAGQWVKPGL